MSEHDDETTLDDVPPEGDDAPPHVDPLSPPDADDVDVEPIGRTPESEAGELRTDEEQGVGVAPTQPGDPSDEHTAEGQGDTAFRPSHEDEEAAE